MALLRAAIVSSVVVCALTADMGTKMATRLSYTELLVWHAIKGRAVGGVALATDRLIAQEVALAPLTVRGIRGSLQAAGLFECKAVTRASVVADDELEFVLRAPEAVAS